MAKSFYVAFETPEDLINPIYEAVREGVASGKVKKGTNEVTKSVERTTAKLVVIAEDVDPPEVVAHLPLICDEHHTPYAFVPSQQDLGKALGLETKSAAAAILDAGDAKHIVDQVIESLAAVRSDSQ
ncbi:MAG: 50S ribosomal protein L7Ae [Nitrosopumilaceae archaeon]|nr:50S ribosomal protein L7Ae [Nitrosopumilaceae archaeon]